MRNDELDRVVPLDHLDDFKVAEGDPDVRGWEVIASDGRRIGEVEQLLIDTAAMKVRYLDVDVENDLLENDSDRHVLIPIGYARLDETDDRVIVDALVSRDVATLPEYTHGPVTREHETTVRSRFDTGFTDTKTEADKDFYAGETYDENRFYGKRRAEGDGRMTLSEEELAVGKRERTAGEVDVRKEVVTEHVARPVETHHEEVTIERRPATGMSGSARIEGDEIRVPLSEEEAVVEKRTVPKEELVVKKHDVVDTEMVEADLRKERVDVDKQGEVRVREDRNDRI